MTPFPFKYPIYQYPKLAHAYVPYQHMSCIFPPIKALASGTIFPELYDPYWK